MNIAVIGRNLEGRGDRRIQPAVDLADALDKKLDLLLQPPLFRIVAAANGLDLLLDLAALRLQPLALLAQPVQVILVGKIMKPGIGGMILFSGGNCFQRLGEFLAFQMNLGQHI